MTQAQTLKATIAKFPKRKCLYCHKLYKPTSARQLYCRPECGTLYRFSPEGEKFPEYICDCGHRWQLDFDPLEDRTKFDNIRCPKCRK